MSSSVVKQALQLLQEDIETSDTTSSGKKRKTKDAMKLISTNRKGVWKELRRLQKQEQAKLQSKFERPDFKSTIEKYKEDQLVSSRRLQKDVAEVAPGINAQKVLEHILQTKKGKTSKNAEKPEEATVFTDRDFDKFEEEYDFFS